MLDLYAQGEFFSVTTIYIAPQNIPGSRIDPFVMYIFRNSLGNISYFIMKMYKHGSFTVADSNLFFEFLGRSSDTSRKQIIMDILGNFLVL